METPLKVVVLVRGKQDFSRITDAIRLVNDIQTFFRFELEIANWLPEGAIGSRLADKAFRKVIATRDSRLPLVVITSRLLRGDNFAFEHRDISVISTADWEDEFAPPPLKIYLAYELAVIACIASADLSDGQFTAMLHAPRGCLFDETSGRDEFHLSLVGSHICAECEGRLAEMGMSDQALEGINEILSFVRAATIRRPRVPATTIFVGHGRAPDWQDLTTFLVQELHVSVDEFNSDPAAGLYTSERVFNMLDKAKFAFLVMTAEDQHADGTMHARASVIHEIGLCQGRLGLKRAVILREEGVSDFSNIHGITYIGFKKGAIREVFPEVTRTLLREGLVDAPIAERVLRAYGVAR